MVERCHRDSGNASDAEFGKNAHDSVEPIFSSAGKDFLFSAQVPSGTPRVPRPNGCLRKAPRQAKDGREITKLTEKVKDRAIRDLYCLARASTLRKFPHCWASCKQTKLSDPDDAGVPSLSVRTPPLISPIALRSFFSQPSRPSSSWFSWLPSSAPPFWISSWQSSSSAPSSWPSSWLPSLVPSSWRFS